MRDFPCVMWKVRAWEKSRKSRTNNLEEAEEEDGRFSHIAGLWHSFLINFFKASMFFFSSLYLYSLLPLTSLLKGSM